MDARTVFEIVMALVTGLLGIILTGVVWWMKTVWAVTSTQQERVQNLHLKFGEYMPRSELDTKLEAIFNQVRELTKAVSALTATVGQFSDERSRDRH